MTSHQLPSEIKTILFVCTGNLCRSVLAEAVAKQNCPLGSYLSISSAGTDAVEGRKSPQDAIDAGRTIRADMLTHRAVRITPEMIQATDTLFIMEPYHEERLLSLVPGSKDKIFYLRSFSGNNDSSLTIDDPYGSSIHVYNECFHLIERCVKNLLSEIDKQTEKK